MTRQFIALKTLDKNTTLYHYTQSAGVQGILDKRCFWATKSDFLNDPKEFSYVIEVIKSICDDEILNKKQRENFLRNVLHGNDFIHEKNKEYYVLCFSTCPDSITLWAEFGNETGYNMAFDSEKVQKKINEDYAIAYHGYVVYSAAAQKRELKKLLWEKIPDYLNCSFSEIMDRGMNHAKDPLFQKACRTFQKVAKIYALFFKQQGFREEKEYRFIFRREKDMKPLFREKDGFLIPYLEIVMKESDNKLPVKAITVAPKNHTDLARKGMEYYLACHGYHTPVKLSNIKLRY